MGLRSQVSCFRAHEIWKHENNPERSVFRAGAIAALSKLKYIVTEKRKATAWSQVRETPESHMQSPCETPQRKPKVRCRPQQAALGSGHQLPFILCGHLTALIRGKQLHLKLQATMREGGEEPLHLCALEWPEPGQEQSQRHRGRWQQLPARGSEFHFEIHVTV